MKNNVVIQFKNVSKKFNSGRRFFLKQALLDLFKPQEDFWALKDVSFQVKKGESIGIIGLNGSGKSTILKLIAGVLFPTEGLVQVDGKIGPLIELGAGFHPELSGRDNIYLNGTILGLTKKEIDEKFNEIVEFAELADFIDTPVKHYSSGMILRLGFSIAVSADPEILIIDEVLSVGDISFQQKCLKLMRDFQKKGVTIILVSHSLQLIQEFCCRAYVLSEKRILSEGKPQTAVYSYLKHLSSAKETKKSNGKSVNNQVSILSFETFDDKKKKSRVFRTGETIIIKINYKTKEEINNPVFGIAIYREDDIHISGPNTKTSNFNIQKIKGQGFVEYRINNTPLLAGKYYITGGIFNSSISQAFDFIERGEYFQILPTEQNQYGLIKLNGQWLIENQHSN